MIPLLTPMYSTSARWQICASCDAGTTDDDRRLHEGPRGGKLDRGRGRETGADRNRAPDHALEAPDLEPRLAERPGRRCRVVDPAVPAVALGYETVQREAVGLVEIEARELDAPPSRRPERDRDLEVDRDGQDEALVVVGVLADQVDPPGRPDELDRTLPGVATLELIDHPVVRHRGQK